MNIEIRGNMKVITVEDGMVMTNWNGENILDFSFCRMIYAPVNTDLDDYREITAEEAQNLIKLQAEEYSKLEGIR